jgi:hypothetical protein
MSIVLLQTIALLCSIGVGGGLDPDKVFDKVNKRQLACQRWYVECIESDKSIITETKLNECIKKRPEKF